jgi:hypothetical protein
MVKSRKRLRSQKKVPSGTIRWWKVETDKEPKENIFGYNQMGKVKISKVTKRKYPRKLSDGEKTKPT